MLDYRDADVLRSIVLGNRGVSKVLAVTTLKM